MDPDTTDAAWAQLEMEEAQQLLDEDPGYQEWLTKLGQKHTTQQQDNCTENERNDAWI